MKNINVFRRLDELETDNLYLRTLLKNMRAEVTTLRDAVTILHNAIRRPVVTPKPTAKPGPKPMRTLQTLEEIRNKRREYARKYYAQKKAAKAAA